MDGNKKFLVALTHFIKFGPIRTKRLRQYFRDDFEAAFRASAKELILAGIEESVANEFAASRTSLDPDAIMGKLAQENISVLTSDDPKYPRNLAEIFNPPEILYYKGRLPTYEALVAVVGSRKITPYGQRTAAEYSRRLAEQGIGIVSGLAYGVDSIAHSSALEADGYTIAVIGSGLDRQSIYPASNRYLADKIVAQDGLVMTEFPVGMPPLRHNFPQRNRIIAGLSKGTLVIEAAEKSGALITAYQAMEMGRDVYAIPGNVYSDMSKGANKLIQQGALCAANPEDILTALDLTEIKPYDRKNILPENPLEELIFAQLSAEPRHIDEIIRATGQAISAINSALTMMEIKGIVRSVGGGKYIIL